MSEETKSQPVQWGESGLDTFEATGRSTSALAPGLWRIDQGRNGPIFCKEKVTTDELLISENSIEKTIFKEIQDFWVKKEKFESLGFLHRRGIILHGPPGTGKTSLIHLVINDTVSRGGIVFYCKDYPSTFMSGLKVFRAIEPDRPIVCLFEDIEEIINNYGARSLLSLLDGENNINHCINLATTNFLDQLDNRIIGRPKRFDRIYKIDYPDDKARQTYFTHKLKPLDISDEVIAEYVGATKGLSFAALADVVISTKCFDVPLGKAVKVLKVYQKAATMKAKGGDSLEKSPFAMSDD